MKHGEFARQRRPAGTVFCDTGPKTSSLRDAAPLKGDWAQIDSRRADQIPQSAIHVMICHARRRRGLFQMMLEAFVEIAQRVADFIAVIFVICALAFLGDEREIRQQDRSPPGGTRLQSRCSARRRPAPCRTRCRGRGSIFVSAISVAVVGIRQNNRRAGRVVKIVMKIVMQLFGMVSEEIFIVQSPKSHR